MTDLRIILLAAGQASRMRGRDKLLEAVEGQPLLRRQAAMARRATSGPVLVALPPAPHPRYGALDDLDVTPLPVPDAAEGMNASLRTAFAALLASDVAGPVNIASGKGVTIADVARMIGVEISAGESSPSPARLVADVSRLRGEVGFTPRYDFESGLADTVAWWRATL